MKEDLMYIENPKTKDSGIVCVIPQKGECPIKCKDCFFQSGRSFLEPLDKNLPNMVSANYVNRNRLVVRVNDGNDSNNQKELVIESTNKYKERFFNTSIPKLDFPGPVVLTINPGNKTDKSFHKLKKIPNNLMFVRFRANTWNTDLLHEAVKYYTERLVPVVITFMAYYNEDIPENEKHKYEFQKRTLNSYWVINQANWEEIVNKYHDNSYVYTCGLKYGDYSCQRCGTCLREYFNTKIRFNIL